MPLATGSRLGPYEVLSRLGAGGMGEVWRGRDTRLGRAVAIKVLPADLAAEGDRLKRFEREARAASSLSHPNIVTVYEIERIESAPVIVMELVEGRTLRELMADGPLPLRRILSIAPQIAEGLAQAHASGIVHRDLKPENVMVTGDGLVKILDFGLAKLTRPEVDSGETTPGSTVSAATRPGIALGTVSYMSPEQASGHPVDFRSDQFSLGSILYEMATGRPVFKRQTTPQTLAAIIEDEPEGIGVAAPKTPAPLRWVISRCLAKEAKGRYASTEDLARELSDLRDHISDLSSGSGVAIEAARPRRNWRMALLAFGAASVLAGMYFLGERAQLSRTSSPRFRQLTFRGAGIGTARFAPDGQTIVFSSQTEGRPPELLSMRLDGPEVRPLGLPPAHILSIGPSGQMAILLLRPFALYPRIGHIALEQVFVRDPFLFDGTLAEASLGGGAPRELAEDVMFADWLPNGSDLAVVRRSGNRHRLELPIGTPVYDEVELLTHVRASHPAAAVAFNETGKILLRRAGKTARIYTGEQLAFEVAWSRTSGEFWYSAPGDSTEIRAVTPEGRDRHVATLAADFVLYDILPDGRVLLGRNVESTEILGSFPEEPRERNLSHFNSSCGIDISGSGETLLFSDVSSPSAGGIYVRKTDGSPPRRLLDGGAVALSPDGRLVLCPEDPPATAMVLVPTGAGQPRRLERESIILGWTEMDRSGFFPDGARVFYGGREAGHGGRVWVQDVDGGRPRAITPENVTRPVLVGDGHFICARSPAFEWSLYPVDGKSDARRVAGIEPGEEPIRSTPDGLLYVRGADELRPGEALMTTRVYRLDPWTGRRELWKEIPPPNLRTGGGISTILFSADGKTCVWTHIRYSTELVLAEGLK
jgi:serine/threonine protein kinase